MRWVELPGHRDARGGDAAGSVPPVSNPLPSPDDLVRDALARDWDRAAQAAAAAATVVVAEEALVASFAAVLERFASTLATAARTDQRARVLELAESGETEKDGRRPRRRSVSRTVKRPQVLEDGWVLYCWGASTRSSYDSRDSQVWTWAATFLVLGDSGQLHVAEELTRHKTATSRVEPLLGPLHPRSGDESMLHRQTFTVRGLLDALMGSRRSFVPPGAGQQPPPMPKPGSPEELDELGQLAAFVVDNLTKRLAQLSLTWDRPSEGEATSGPQPPV